MARPSGAIDPAAAVAFGGVATAVRMAWPREERAATTASTVLRVQLSENGGEEEGYRWTGGRIYVRHEATLPAPPAETRSSRL